MVWNKLKTCTCSVVCSNLLFRPQILLLVSHENEEEGRNSVSHFCVQPNKKFGEVSNRLPHVVVVSNSVKKLCCHVVH